MIKLNRFSWCVLLVTCAVSTVFGQGAAADQPGGEKEQKLIAVLKSDAAAADKAMACKQLAVYGTAQAVPSLAPLLSDENLASWSRIALEAIPGEASLARDPFSRGRARLWLPVCVHPVPPSADPSSQGRAMRPASSSTPLGFGGL